MTSDELKRSISMREAVEQYGIKVNGHGFCCCPFHKEKTASMKIYKDSYNCFGCGANGDIFSFVMGMEHCDFKTAFKSLGGTYKEQSDYQHRMFNYRMQKRKETEQMRILREKEEKKQILEEIELQKLFVKLFPVFDDDWCTAMNRLEYLFYRLELLTEKR
jgi:DNA primase